MQNKETGKRSRHSRKPVKRRSQYIRYESALDDTLIGIEHLNSGYLTHCILEPRTLARYLEAVEDDLAETAPAFEPVFTNVYQY